MENDLSYLKNAFIKLYFQVVFYIQLILIYYSILINDHNMFNLNTSYHQ